MTGPPAWSDGSGRLSPHVVRAAIHAARILDHDGSRMVEARESYWHHATGGLFSPSDLIVGEDLLVDCGLVVELGESFHLTPRLSEFLEGTDEDLEAFIYFSALDYLREHGLGAYDDAATLEQVVMAIVADPLLREEILLALARRVDDSRRRLIGNIGEEIVVRAARTELEELGYPSLARAVRHVSLQSDQLGYDISAPRIFGSARLLEVKATVDPSTDALTVFVSRNEVETGMRFADWALVVCRIEDVVARRGAILGWCNANSFRDLLPRDSEGGEWQQATIRLQIGALLPNLPGLA